MPLEFPAVQAVLNNIITNWKTGNGGVAPDLLGPSTHKTALFAWDTLGNLLNSSARGDQLIQPNIIGHVGQGKTANLVVALTGGVSPFPSMPDGGLDSVSGKFLDIGSPEIQTIIAWIEGGCQP